jgi:hypothetical protein
MASLRAAATLARRMPERFAIAMPHALSEDQRLALTPPGRVVSGPHPMPHTVPVTIEVEPGAAAASATSAPAPRWAV